MISASSLPKWKLKVERHVNDKFLSCFTRLDSGQDLDVGQLAVPHHVEARGPLADQGRQGADEVLSLRPAGKQPHRRLDHVGPGHELDDALALMLRKLR